MWLRITQEREDVAVTESRKDKANLQRDSQRKACNQESGNMSGNKLKTDKCCNQNRTRIPDCTDE